MSGGDVMKRILLYIFLVVPYFSMAQNSNEPSQVSVHVGENRLAELLTEEQKQHVTSLTVTGTLEDEDYAFLRAGLLEQLDTLNLRDAEIDTIPDGALVGEYIKHKLVLYLVLPRNIKYLGDYAFCGKCEVTGQFPFLGDFMLDFVPKPLFQVSEGHPDLVNIVEDDYYAIYSQDGKELYCMQPNWEGSYGKSNLELFVKEGTEVIKATAFRGEFLDMISFVTIILPSTLDSIGAQAFSDICIDLPIGKAIYPNGGSRERGCLICNAGNPPKYDMLIGDYLRICNLYVPKASMELYKQLEPWNRMPEIKSIENLINKGDGIFVITQDHPSVSVQTTYDSYILTSTLPFIQIELLDINGRLLHSLKSQGTEYTLSKKNLAPSVYSNTCTLY